MANEKISILKLLIEHQGENLSIRKISILRGINYKSAYQSLRKLEQEKVVTLSRAGNTLLCSFSQYFNQTVFDAEYQRREELLKDKNFRILQNALNRVNITFIALLFGSFAKAINTRESDIDLLIISEDFKLIENEISTLPLKIHLNNVTVKEFTNMLKSREQTVVSEALKKSIILVGIEDYYRLLQNAQ